MADETPTPLSATELRDIAERAAQATPAPWFRHPNGTAWDGVWNGAATLVIANTEHDSDLDFIAAARTNIPRLLATLAAYREIVAAVAGYDATYCGIEIGHECALNAQQRARTGGQDFGCHWNKFEDDRTRHMFVHGENCPVTRARALLADTQTPGQESE